MNPLPRLTSANVFTIVDIYKGYWQVVLQVPMSRKLKYMAIDIGSVPIQDVTNGIQGC